MPNLATARALLLGKVESTDGTDATPAVASDVMYLAAPFEPGHSYAFDHEPRPLARGPFLHDWKPLGPKGRIGEWTIPTHLRGSRSGAAYSASVLPDLNPLFRGAGMSQSIVTTPGSETVTYLLAASALEGATYYYYTDGKLRKLLGAKTTSLSISGSAGAPVSVEATVKGLYQAPSDTALPSPTAAQYGTSNPPVAVGLTATIDAVGTYVIRDFNFTVATDAPDRPSVGASDGLAVHKVRKQTPTWSITLEDELIATKDFEALRAAGTPLSISVAVGSVQYNRFTISSASTGAFIRDVQPGDDGGVQVLRLSGSLHGSDLSATDTLTVLFN